MNNATSPNSHPLNPTNKSNSLFIDANHTAIKWMNLGSDEIKLGDNKQSISDPSNINIPDIYLEHKNQLEGK